jgi:hypothetical protein
VEADEAAAAWSMAWQSRATVKIGVRRLVAVLEPGSGARSRRMMAWKCTTPRGCYSATLT